MPHPFSTATPEQFSAEVWRLHRLACPDEESRGRFNRAMLWGKAKGLTYIEALEVAAKRTPISEAE